MRAATLATVAAAALVALPASGSPVGRVRLHDAGPLLPRPVAPESAVHFGLVSVVSGKLPFGVAQFAAWRTDGTRAGTRRIGRFTYSQSRAPLAKPVAGRAWSLAPSFDFEGYVLTFVSPREVEIGRLVDRVDLPYAAVAGEHIVWVASYLRAGEFSHPVVEAHPGGRTDLSGIAAGITPIAGGLVFAMDAGDGTGFEPWLIPSPGAAAVPLGETRPGDESGGFEPLGIAGGLVVFATDDGESGREPWIADPVARAIRPLADLAPGPLSSDPESLGARGATVLVAATMPAIGREPCVLDPVTGTATPLDLVPGIQSPESFSVSWTRSGLWIAIPSADGTPQAWRVSDGTATLAAALPVGGRADDVWIESTPVGEVRLVAERGGAQSSLVVQRSDPSPATTEADHDADGFPDDVEIAFSIDPADASSTPAGNARSRPGPTMSLRSVRDRGAFVRVECVLPAPDLEDTLAAGGVIVDAGGAVAGAYFGDGVRSMRTLGATITRSRLPDGRLLLRARIPVRRGLRHDGANGGVPVLVWRDAERSEARGAR